jgi:acyl carrier protein
MADCVHTQTRASSNNDKLQQLVVDVFLIDPAEFRLDLGPRDIDTWDSLGVVSLATGIQEVFGLHLSADEMLSIQKVGDIVKLLEGKGVHFDC